MMTAVTKAFSPKSKKRPAGKSGATPPPKTAKKVQEKADKIEQPDPWIPKNSYLFPYLNHVDITRQNEYREDTGKPAPFKRTPRSKVQEGDVVYIIWQANDEAGEPAEPAYLGKIQAISEDKNTIKIHYADHSRHSQNERDEDFSAEVEEDQVIYLVDSSLNLSDPSVEDTERKQLNKTIKLLKNN